jgi:hypothetical protein
VVTLDDNTLTYWNLGAGHKGIKVSPGLELWQCTYLSADGLGAPGIKTHVAFAGGNQVGE